jgi:hypothetical protein
MQYFANPSVTAEPHSDLDCSAGAPIHISERCFLPDIGCSWAGTCRTMRSSVTFKILEELPRLWFAFCVLTCDVTEVTDGLSPSDSMLVSLFAFSFNSYSASENIYGFRRQTSAALKPDIHFFPIY